MADNLCHSFATTDSTSAGAMEYANQFTPPPLASTPISPRKRQGGLSVQSILGTPSFQARYDAQRITPDNIEHWANADIFGPNYSNNHYVRNRLRQRSRYEAVENNSYLKGIVLTLCNDFVCSGPAIQITDPDIPNEVAREIECKFNGYSKAIRLRQLLWQLRHAKMVDGEGFAMQFTDTSLDKSYKSALDDDQPYPQEVLVNWRTIEADQVTTLWNGGDINSAKWDRMVDGIKFDRHMRPTDYHVLYDHPNDMVYQPLSGTQRSYGRWIKADYILHWTRTERPWLRGVPETTQALPLCAYLRRYNLAVLDAAETAANFSGVLESDAMAADPSAIFGTQAKGDNLYRDPTTGQVIANDGYEDDDFEPFPLSRGLFTKLPDGYKLSQMKAEQPTERHDEFVDTVIREIARALNIPFNIAVGFSGGYNFASGTLDRQLYNNAIAREREGCEDNILCNIVESWWDEALHIPTYFDGYKKRIEKKEQERKLQEERRNAEKQASIDKQERMLEQADRTAPPENGNGSSNGAKSNGANGSASTKKTAKARFAYSPGGVITGIAPNPGPPASKSPKDPPTAPVGPDGIADPDALPTEEDLQLEEAKNFEFTPNMRVPKYEWRWDVQPEHADPVKVAEAITMLWDKGFITDEQIQMDRFNRDPEEHHQALKRQNEFRKANNLPLPGVTTTAQATVGASAVQFGGPGAGGPPGGGGPPKPPGGAKASVALANRVTDDTNYNRQNPDPTVFAAAGCGEDGEPYDA